MNGLDPATMLLIGDRDRDQGQGMMHINALGQQRQQPRGPQMAQMSFSDNPRKGVPNAAEAEQMLMDMAASDQYATDDGLMLIESLARKYGVRTPWEIKGTGGQGYGPPNEPPINMTPRR